MTEGGELIENRERKQNRGKRSAEEKGENISLNCGMNLNQ